MGERALKKAILHRKNALFCQTPTGAHVGDLFMSLIHTCELAGANPFDDLTMLQQLRDALAATPAAWMPWNYRDTRAAVTTAASSAAPRDFRRRAGRTRCSEEKGDAPSGRPPRTSRSDVATESR
jgi:hypothetical protein